MWTIDKRKFDGRALTMTQIKLRQRQKQAPLESNREKWRELPPLTITFDSTMRRGNVEHEVMAQTATPSQSSVVPFNTAQWRRNILPSKATSQSNWLSQRWNATLRKVTSCFVLQQTTNERRHQLSYSQYYAFHEGEDFRIPGGRLCLSTSTATASGGVRAFGVSFGVFSILWITHFPSTEASEW